MMTRENLWRHVRDALVHFHDPTFLQTSPLVTVFLPGSEGSVPSRLQAILREGVECLRPSLSIPPERAEWFGYRILQYRYFQLRNIYAVCDELALSPASLYRYQQQAIEALADILWSKHQCDSAPSEPPRKPIRATPDEQAVYEAVRLAHTARRESVDLGDLMESVRQTFAPLAMQQGIPFILDMAASLPRIHGDAAVFHQIVINVLAGSLDVGPVDVLRLQVRVSGHEIIWRLADICWDDTHDEPLTRPEFALSQSLLGAYGGHLWVERKEGRIHSLCFALPHTKLPTILIIEDDEDTIHLYQRYLQQHGYVLRIAHGGDEAWQLLMEETPPSLIILDVLMPREDGWMILQRLKILPETADIPVIVYSVLGQPSLALALGALKVLRKPIREEDLLKAILAALPPQDSLD